MTLHLAFGALRDECRDWGEGKLCGNYRNCLWMDVMGNNSVHQKIIQRVKRKINFKNLSLLK